MNRKLKIFPVVFALIPAFFVTGCNRVAENNMKISVVGTENASEDISEEGTDEDYTAENESQPYISEENTEDAAVCVYLCGAVENEDVYSVPAGSRVNDVVVLAGGLSEDAAAQYINLARVVSDGERIYIPYEGDISDDMSERLIQTHDITEDSVDAIGKGLININSADKNELMTLPGIGEKKAEDIIRYREDNGGFKSVEDLMNVDGIKEGTFQKLKDKITI